MLKKDWTRDAHALIGRDEVIWLQIVLNRLVAPSLDVDGFYGPVTKATVGRFQRDQGLRVTRELDGTTTLVVAARAIEERQQSTAPGRPVPWAEHSARALAQRRVRAFQRRAGLEPDGIVGKETRAAILDELSMEEEPTAKVEVVAVEGEPTTRIEILPIAGPHHPGGELGTASFPPLPRPPQWEHLRQLLSLAEARSKMPGLYSFLLALANAESGGQSSAMTAAGEGDLPLAQLFSRRNFHHRFRNNPWRPRVPNASDPAADRWRLAGGWFGLMPAIALATTDRRALLHDPARVFDPAYSVAYAVDLVHRLWHRRGAKAWSDVWAWWPRLARGDAPVGWYPKPEAFGQLLRNLEAVRTLGARPATARELVRVDDYPGFAAISSSLRRECG